MDLPILLSPSTPQFPSRKHVRTPSRSPTRHRIMDDILADLSPTATLEAFTSTSGKLRASIESASPTQRAFGIRATIASKKIQEWVCELSAWPWPAGGSEGFLTPVNLRREACDTIQGTFGQNQVDVSAEDVEFWGCLPAEDVICYESRIDNIWEDMEDLDVEEIKRQIMESHVLPISRPSTSRGPDNDVSSSPSPLQYSKMDDFTTVVTATVLKALPNLSRLNALMNVWSIRLAVLRQVPKVILSLEDAEIALTSGWNAINISVLQGSNGSSFDMTGEFITRQAFQIMRNALQDKVTILGQLLDNILDALEGQEDSMPDTWLDRMEAIERDYGNWVVCGDRRVREGEWAKEIARRMQEQNFKLPGDDCGLNDTAAQDSKNLVSEAMDTPEKEGFYARGRNLHDETREAGNQSPPDFPGLIRDPNGLDSVPAEISGKPFTQEPQQNSGGISGQICVAMGTSSFDLDDKDTHRCVLDDNVKSDEDFLFQRHAMKDLSNHMGDMEAPYTTRVDPENEALSSDEITTAGCSEDQTRASSEEETKDYFLNHPSNPDTEQSTPPTESKSPRLPSFDGLEDVATVSELQEIPLLLQRNQNANEWSGSTLQTTMDQASLPVSNRDEQVDFNRDTPNILSHCEKQVQDDMGLYGSVSGTGFVPTIERIGPAIPMTSQPNFTTPEASDDDETHSTPRTPSFPSESRVVHAINPTSNQQKSGCFIADGDRSRSPSAVQQLSLHFANALKQIRPPSQSSTPDEGHDFSAYLKHSEDDDPSCYSQSLPGAVQSQEYEIGGQRAESETCISGQVPLPRTDNFGGVLFPNILFPKTPETVSQAEPTFNSLDLGEGTLSIKDSADNYSGEPGNMDSPNEATTVPKIHEPIISIESFPTPIGGECSKLDVSNDFHFMPPCSISSAGSVSETSATEMRSVEQSGLQVSNRASTIKPSHENACASYFGAVEAADVEKPDTNEKIVPQCTPESTMASLKESPSSDASTTILSEQDPLMPYPLPLESAQTPKSPFSVNDSTCLENIDEESPSFGRVSVYDDLGGYSPPSSPSSMIAASKRYQLQQLSTSPDSNAEAPTTPPFFSNVEVSPAPISSPSKVSTDQFQQQISEILDSIPARIRLTSEPDIDQRSDITQPKKRSSLGAGLRPMSRSSTPSFTLAPAYAKNPRPRTQNGNPEIKLYHLSRGTGEAPIKLFVRLVGEHGERVMVRVGGGWADLGEYLREYASHHGRKSDKTGKVEIQDLPSRVVSVGSTHSASTIRNAAGRSSPVSRPNSSLDCPQSSLSVRKTRKSAGAGEDIFGRERSPSTPQSCLIRNSPSLPRQSETPPSVASRPVSRHSWTEEDSPLGLAGPTSKKVDISAESAAWVESMKEKVRMASAEKKEKTIPAATDFGQLGKVGGTKRLFKKGSM